MDRQYYPGSWPITALVLSVISQFVMEGQRVSGGLNLRWVPVLTFLTQRPGSRLQAGQGDLGSLADKGARVGEGTGSPWCG